MDWYSSWAWIYTPWFTVGDTDITLARVAGLLFIVALAWWSSSLLEKGLRRVAQDDGAHGISSCSV